MSDAGLFSHAAVEAESDMEDESSEDDTKLTIQVIVEWGGWRVGPPVVKW